jgi:hypothetical protein
MRKNQQNVTDPTRTYYLRYALSNTVVWELRLLCQHRPKLLEYVDFALQLAVV